MLFKKKTHNKLSDIVLVEKYKSTGDMKVIEEIFSRYSHLVYGVCFKYLRNSDECKDAVMEIFEKLRETLPAHQITNFKSWLYSVAKNYCLMKIRSEGKYTIIPLPEDEENEKDFMELPEILHLINEEDKNRQIEQLQKAIEELEDGQKICIKMFFLENKSYNEINSITGYNFNQVKSNIQNGKRNLKNKLIKFKADFE